MGLHVSGIWSYPVKALRGTELQAASVEPLGLSGDRRFMVVDAAGHALTQRTVPSMASVAALIDRQRLRLVGDGDRDLLVPLAPVGPHRTEVVLWRSRVQAADCGDVAAAWLSSRLGQPCRLVYMAEPCSRPIDPTFARPGEHVSFADGFPVLLTSGASLFALNAHSNAPVSMSRFRPNLVVDGGSPWAEDGWRQVKIGPVVFRVAKPCTRCIVVTVDQVTGIRPSRTEPLRTLGTLHRDAAGAIIFGQNLIPERTGTIRLGDIVEVN